MKVKDLFVLFVAHGFDDLLYCCTNILINNWSNILFCLSQRLLGDNIRHNSEWWRADQIQLGVINVSEDARGRMGESLLGLDQLPSTVALSFWINPTMNAALLWRGTSLIEWLATHCHMIRKIEPPFITSTRKVVFFACICLFEPEEETKTFSHFL